MEITDKRSFMEMNAELKHSVLSPDHTGVCIKARRKEAWKKKNIYLSSCHFFVVGFAKTLLIERLTSDSLIWYLPPSWSKIHLTILVNMPYRSLCQIGPLIFGLYHYIKDKTKIHPSILSHDFTTNTHQREHVWDRTVKCTAAVHKQLHSAMLEPNLPVLWRR